MVVHITPMQPLIHRAEIVVLLDRKLVIKIRYKT